MDRSYLLLGVAALALRARSRVECPCPQYSSFLEMGWWAAASGMTTLSRTRLRYVVETVDTHTSSLHRRMKVNKHLCMRVSYGLGKMTLLL